ncbi:MAG: glycosyltransferase family 10 [Bacteroidales bacterium]|nr:glycosyltransferase family 10 [Bacteroidales bacterium]
MKDVNVLIITGKTNVSCRQLPGGESELTSGDRQYHFFINDVNVQPDIVVVRNKYLKKKRSFNVSPHCTLLMISEPRSVMRFTKRYCNQFGMVYSCQENIEHDNVVYGPALLPWFVGVENISGKSRYTMNYEDVAASKPEKSKLISVITSSKAFTHGHQDRLVFVARLKARYGDSLDVYGRGLKEFNDKWDVLAPYKYHIAIENSSSRYYWTEKLSDCYLAGCYPIYYGCKNIGDYFEEGAFNKIDIKDFDGACDIIDKVIIDDLYGKRTEQLKESKVKVMEDYNMFRIIANCCDKMDIKAEKKLVSIGITWDMWICNFVRYAIVSPIMKSIFAIRRIMDGKLQIYCSL